MKKWIYFLFLIYSFINFQSCDPGRYDNTTGELNPTQPITRNELPENFAQFEVNALSSLCSSYAFMQYDYFSVHEFTYKRMNCFSQNESYSLGLKTVQGDYNPKYSSDSSLFYFKDFQLNARYPFKSFCDLMKGDLTQVKSRIIESQGQMSILEVVVNRVDVNGNKIDKIKSTPGCYSPGMLSSDTTDNLVCLRLWTVQSSIGGNQGRDISFESNTIYAIPYTKYFGYFVYKKFIDYIRCSDTSKQEEIQATRTK